MSDIPEVAIEAGARAIRACERTPKKVTTEMGVHLAPMLSTDVAEAVLRAAAPHLLKEAHSAIGHLHNDVGTLTDQLNRARTALYRIVSELGVPDPDYPAPVSNAFAIAREALRNLEAPSE